MSLYDARPDMGACSGIPDIGAWQFVKPDGIQEGVFVNRPIATMLTKGKIRATGALGSRIVVEGKLES